MFLVTYSDLETEIPKLTGENYKSVEGGILLRLECMVMDYAIRKEEPHASTDVSTPSKVAFYETWERSNCICMMFVRSHLLASINNSIGERNDVKGLLKAIDELFESLDKAFTSTLMT